MNILHSFRKKEYAKPSSSLTLRIMSLALISGFLFTSNSLAFVQIATGGGWGAPKRASDKDKNNGTPTTTVYQEPHTTHSFDVSMNDSAPYKAELECNKSGCTASISYSYHDPSCSVELNLPKASSSAANPLVSYNAPAIIFEQGTTLTKDKNTFKATFSNGEDSYSTYLGALNNDIIQDKNKIISLKNASGVLVTPRTADETTLILSDTTNTPLPAGKYTLTSSVTDTYYKTNNTVSTSTEFYIGPYPTVYYNCILEDDNMLNINNTTHSDKIIIKDIKLLSTYEPKKLKFTLKAGTYSQTKTVDIKPTSLKNYALNSTTNIGYVSEFNDITIDWGSSGLKNIDPLTNPYLTVEVIDGRTGTADASLANTPKLAKYSTSVASL